MSYSVDTPGTDITGKLKKVQLALNTGIRYKYPIDYRLGIGLNVNYVHRLNSISSNNEALLYVLNKQTFILASCIYKINIT